MVGVTETVKNVPTAEDQQQINKFARLHKAYLENKEQLAFLNNTSQNLTDAENELMLLDDEESKVPILVGSIFVHQDQELRAILYSKFGDNIQLEDEQDNDK
ncbi:Prefoldin subunit 4 [Meloidogyne graminicola]|uniref:Prefoldin subunit 4 n=1 Tax=Meloidogyne graminicola TaxID=189291 RepID=A0A8S9ZXC0_9BILA|nr:Prefoldin subunit 4 [Meloidogyne graminicola]